MIALAGSVLVASLLGSPHCAGMCGGFVCFYAAQGGRGQALAHAAYNFGRLFSYLVLGLLAGALGRTLEQAGAGAGLHGTAAVAAGVVMIVWGGATLLTAAGARLPRAAAPGFLRERFAAAVRAVHAQPPAGVRAFARRWPIRSAPRSPAPPSGSRPSTTWPRPRTCTRRSPRPPPASTKRKRRSAARACGSCG